MLCPAKSLASQDWLAMAMASQESSNQDWLAKAMPSQEFS